MRCQCNKIRLAPASWANELDNRASARERWSASLGMPVWLPVPAVQIPRYCVSDVQHLMGERPQIELTLYRSDFGFSSVSGAWKRHGCDAIATAHTAQALLMKVPSRSSRAACCSSACVFITIGDGFPKRFP